MNLEQSSQLLKSILSLFDNKKSKFLARELLSVRHLFKKIFNACCHVGFLTWNNTSVLAAKKCQLIIRAAAFLHCLSKTKGITRTRFHLSQIYCSLVNGTVSGWI